MPSLRRSSSAARASPHRAATSHTIVARHRHLDTAAISLVEVAGFDAVHPAIPLLLLIAQCVVIERVQEPPAAFRITLEDVARTIMTGIEPESIIASSALLDNGDFAAQDFIDIGFRRH